MYAMMNVMYSFNGIPMDRYFELKFYSIVDLPFKDFSTFSYLVYFEQLFFGNKRQVFYSNLLIAVALILFPKTWPAAMFFIAQMPVEFILNFIVFPLYPEYDVPY